MRALLFMILLVLASSAGSPRPPTQETSLQSQLHLQEPNKETIRHGKKKRMRMGGGRGKKRQRQGTARRYVEKQYLVQNRTLALLGDEVQRILHSTKGFTLDIPGKPSRSTNQKNLSHSYPERKNTTLPTFKNVTRKVKNQNRSFVGGKKGTKLLNTLNTNNGSQTEDSEEEDLFREGEVDFVKEEYDLDITSLKDDVQVNLNNALIHIITAIENFTAIHVEGMTPCQKLADCKNKLQNVFLGPLPSCPCHYPTGIFYEDKIWDDTHQKFFRWKDASGERLDIYKAGADYCIRSLIAHGSTSLSAQHCCYDRGRKLLTRGSGAGSPNYVSPDVSAILHEKIDILPWRLCKGDFTRFNKVRPPNNGNLCKENPEDIEFNKQVQITISY